ncbi:MULTISPECIES: FeoB-associated Cys-rich membrane protein [Desulfitobacterium]|uniref:FeoB-associated Cys-rich membrane protein n=1 Tax=Desulfitobacterium dehalogenans (strain ATCC 51507 / DSM 9161 / JW/IU-DC1) TaxID=756499 RepID=I4AB62_DESDJ|nr:MULTISPECIES: FeoB-associated Cys-rich membrane protein [Desulfitobacterium]AFM01197.1 hypothetical protein Desde_2894 [Desulfitobacterium dehalogenans ATCC 51507]
MLEWIISNGANLIIGAVVLAIAALAGLNVYRTRKSGGCSGCSSSCGSGSECSVSDHKP